MTNMLCPNCEGSGKVFQAVASTHGSPGGKQVGTQVLKVWCRYCNGNGILAGFQAPA